MAAGFRKAIEWIALNDEPGEMDVEVVSGMIAVALVADLFDKDSEDVATTVIRYRKKHCD